MPVQPILEIAVTIRREDCTSFSTPNGKVTFLPFAGTATGDLISGTVRPGGVDVQVTDAAGVRHMCARYVIEGADNTGAPCHLYVENNAYFQRGNNPQVFEATPTFMTDSAALASYSHRAHFRAEGHPAAGGVTIKIFDLDDEQ
jgi:hypothetical protein